MPNKYSKSFKENAVKAYRSSGLIPTDFAFKYGIPDSTFLIGANINSNLVQVFVCIPKNAF